tara:strand:+ start:318 stop:767 length:450 start_codon:yes stop_codon:yes gene_type:complete
MAFKLDKNKFDFGHGTSPTKLANPIAEGKKDAKKLREWASRSPKDRNKVFTAKNVLKQTGNFITGRGGAGRFNPILGPAGLDVQGAVDNVKNNMKTLQQSKKSQANVRKTKLKAKLTAKYKSLAAKHGPDKAKQIMKKSFETAKGKRKL